MNRAVVRAALVRWRSQRVLTAEGIRLVSAACRVARTDMTAIASTVCIVNIRELLLRRNVGRVDTIAEPVVRRNVESRAENAAGNDSRGYVDDVIRETATIGVTRRIASDQPHPAPARESCGSDAGVEPQKVGDG